MRAAAVALFLVAAALPARAQPSFDCARATAWDERAICADPALAALDRRIAAAWRARTDGIDDARRQAMLADQRAWLRDRRACNTGTEKPEACLLRQMTQRAQALDAAPADKPAPAAAAPAPAPGPARPRGCGAAGRDLVGAALCADAALRAREAELVARTNRLAAGEAARDALLAAHAGYEREREACAAEGIAAEVARCLGEVIGDRLAALPR
ncbi:hypothetical protein [Falsiroseomonas sp. CW058]|uniref:hypothetical protein n=1 Tax=Falsiroseomonas sp. CW058 TaxID=3388664 RepID=UPI003D316DD7